ncbi:MAG: ZIP family metal transporter [Gemmatimonadetes bacterium]|nr:ZIP family metal transporter [Gemmatimonadota bacterium]
MTVFGDPTLTVLLFASLAALTASLGVLPQAIRGRPPSASLGWSNALAAGLMLGVAYALITTGLAEGVFEGGAGALMGMGIVRASHAVTDTTDLPLNELDGMGPAYGYQVVLVNTLHAAWEGVAIGVAMLVSLPFGISMAIALAAHNIPEAMNLTTILVGRGVSLSHAAALAVATNVNQVLLAVVTFAVVGVLPALRPWTVGFAAGALIYLVLVELLPEAYHQAGKTSIAMVTLVAMGVVVGLTGGAP